MLLFPFSDARFRGTESARQRRNILSRNDIVIARDGDGFQSSEGESEKNNARMKHCVGLFLQHDSDSILLCYNKT
jgi:hypothetical protein